MQAPQEMQVLDFELIKHMDFGPVWHETLSEDEALPGQYIREFRHGEDPEAVIRLFYRGGPLGKLSAATLVQTLGQAPHALSESEKSSLITVIKSASEPEWFKMEALETIFWNGKTVLKLQGAWIEPQSSFLAFYVCADESGQDIHEFHYFAPQTKFDKYLPDAKRVFESVQWR